MCELLFPLLLSQQLTFATCCEARGVASTCLQALVWPVRQSGRHRTGVSQDWELGAPRFPGRSHTGSPVGAWHLGSSRVVTGSSFWVHLSEVGRLGPFLVQRLGWVSAQSRSSLLLLQARPPPSASSHPPQPWICVFPLFSLWFLF